MAAKDVMPGHPPAADSPYANAAAVVPSDTTDLTFVTRALYVGVTGDVTVNMPGGAAILFKAMPVGLYNLRVSRVKATGTAATNIVALW
jgi:hypothetical protein